MSGISPTELRELISVARSDGFRSAVVDANLTQLEFALRFALVSPVANRAHGEVRTTLRPIESDAARPNSMSAVVGTGEQPLHVDGAQHFPLPPDFTLLFATTASSTPTRIYRPSITEDQREDLQHGIFKVTSGRDCFLAPALADGRLRYDPICMEPLDARARSVRDLLGDPDGVVEHSWDGSAGNLLVIDNRTTLHGRAAVRPGDEHREIVRINLVESR